MSPSCFDFEQTGMCNANVCACVCAWGKGEGRFITNLCDIFIITLCVFDVIC